jgi:hypothetical protein
LRNGIGYLFCWEANLVSRVTITLGQDEHEALVKSALDESRTPREQARHILREGLRLRGFLEDAGQNCSREDLMQVIPQHALVEAETIVTMDGTNFLVVLVSPPPRDTELEPSPQMPKLGTGTKKDASADLEGGGDSE